MPRSHTGIKIPVSFKISDFEDSVIALEYDEDKPRSHSGIAPDC